VKRPSLVPVALAALAVLAAAGIPLVGPAEPAFAATGTSVLSVSSLHDPDYPIGRQRVGVGESAVIETASLTRGVTMHHPASTPGGSDYMTISVTPEEGKQLALGRYTYDYHAMDPFAAQVRISIGSIQQAFVGEFEVLDLAADASGKLRRFDIVFRNGTDSSERGLFGQLRFGQPSDTGAVLSATTIRYPNTPIGFVPILATETITNTTGAAVTIGAASVTSGASDFRISNDRCSRTTLAPKARCTMQIGFVPSKAGPRAGIASVKVGSGTRQISLTGTVPVGRSGFSYGGNDYISGGTTHSYPDGRFLNGLGWQASLGWMFSPGTVYGLEGAGDSDISIQRYDGGPIQVGTFDTSEAARPVPGSTAKYGFAVSGSGRGCGQTGRVTISSWKVDATGKPVSARLSWTLSCTYNDSGTMTGSLYWRDRTDKTNPAPVTGLKVTTANGVRKATWSGSTSPDAAGTIARLLPGTGALAVPTAGLPVSAGTATSGTLPTLVAGQRYRLFVWSIDSTGNVGAPVSVAVTG
jgi:hypothetical protein